MTFTDAELDALVIWLDKEALAAYGQLDVDDPKDHETAKAAAAITYLRTRDPIGAVIMQERAAKQVDDHGEWMKSHNLLGNGYDFAGQAKAIRAIPIPTDAEQLAYARELPEIKALVDEMEWALPILRRHLDHPNDEGALLSFEAALAALEPKP